MRRALSDLDRYTKTHLRTHNFPQDKKKRQEIFGELGECLNTVEIACVTAYKHPRSDEKRWSGQADDESLKIYGLIQKHNLIEGDEPSVNSNLPKLEKALSSYSGIFEARLREHREKMLEIPKCAMV